MSQLLGGLKALFLDMDDTLCDTQSANRLASKDLIKELQYLYPHLDTKAFVDSYLAAVYRDLSPELAELTQSITDETEYRQFVFDYFLRDFGVTNYAKAFIVETVASYDSKRMQYYAFYPGVEQLLAELRQQYKLVVVTNGPVYSQRPKLMSVDMDQHVDFIIVGGEEPESKPATSIFMKACRLADCEPHEALHAGDSYKADIEGANQAGIKSFWINESLPDLVEHYQEADYASPRFVDITKFLTPDT